MNQGHPGTDSGQAGTDPGQPGTDQGQPGTEQGKPGTSGIISKIPIFGTQQHTFVARTLLFLSTMYDLLMLPQSVYLEERETVFRLPVIQQGEIGKEPSTNGVPWFYDKQTLLKMCLIFFIKTIIQEFEVEFFLETFFNKSSI